MQTNCIDTAGIVFSIILLKLDNITLNYDTATYHLLTHVWHTQVLFLKAPILLQNTHHEEEHMVVVNVDEFGV